MSTHTKDQLNSVLPIPEQDIPGEQPALGDVASRAVRHAGVAGLSESGEAGSTHLDGWAETIRAIDNPELADRLELLVGTISELGTDLELAVIRSIAEPQIYAPHLMDTERSEKLKASIATRLVRAYGAAELGSLPGGALEDRVEAKRKVFGGDSTSHDRLWKTVIAEQMDEVRIAHNNNDSTTENVVAKELIVTLALCDGDYVADKTIKGRTLIEAAELGLAPRLEAVAQDLEGIVLRSGYHHSPRVENAGIYLPLASREEDAARTLHTGIHTVTEVLKPIQSSIRAIRLVVREEAPSIEGSTDADVQNSTQLSLEDAALALVCHNKWVADESKPADPEFVQGMSRIVIQNIPDDSEYVKSDISWEAELIKKACEVNPDIVTSAVYEHDFAELRIRAQKGDAFYTGARKSKINIENKIAELCALEEYGLTERLVVSGGNTPIVEYLITEKLKGSPERQQAAIARLKSIVAQKSAVVSELLAETASDLSLDDRSQADLTDLIHQSHDPESTLAQIKLLTETASTTDANRLVARLRDLQRSYGIEIGLVSEQKLLALEDPALQELVRCNFLTDDQVKELMLGPEGFDLGTLRAFVEVCSIPDVGLAAEYVAKANDRLKVGPKNGKSPQAVMQMVTEALQDETFGTATDLLIALVRSGMTSEVLNSLKTQKVMIDESSLLNALIDDASSFNPVDSWLKSFTLLNNQVAERILNGPYPLIVLRHIEKFPDLNHNELALKVLREHDDRGPLDTFTRYMDRLDSLDNDIALTLARRGYGEEVTGSLHAFDRLDTATVAQLISYTKVDIQKVVTYLLEHPEIAMPEDLERAYGIFGVHLSNVSYTAFQLIMEGQIDSAALRSLNVTESGEPGLRQLERSLVNITKDIFLTGKIAPELLQNGIVVDYIKSIVRFDSSEWGSHDNSELIRVLGMESPELAEAYKYAEITVQKIDKIQVQNFEIPEDAADEYRRLAEDLAVARLIFTHNYNAGEQSMNIENYNTLVNSIVSLSEARARSLEKGIAAMSAKLGVGQADQSLLSSIAALETQQDFLRSVTTERMKNIDDFIRSFAGLAKYKELERPLRTMLFVEMIARFPDAGFDTRLNPGNVSIDSISIMKDVVSHITKQEVWSEMMGDSSAAALKQLLGSKGLEHALELFDKRSTGSTITTTFGLLPTRGPLMELSGHVSDACWASVYDSIAEEYPNMTALMIVKNPGKKSQRFAGAAMLIETTSKAGEPLLVVRGLNPLQTDINALDQASFVDEISGYVKEVAKKAGRKAAIVIDGHSGGSGTNRPMLFAYLSGLKKSLSLVQIDDDSSTTFNGYPIGGVTYLL